MSLSNVKAPVKVDHVCGVRVTIVWLNEKVLFAIEFERQIMNISQVCEYFLIVGSLLCDLEVYQSFSAPLWGMGTGIALMSVTSLQSYDKYPVSTLTSITLIATYNKDGEVNF